MVFLIHQLESAWSRRLLWGAPLPRHKQSRVSVLLLAILFFPGFLPATLGQDERSTVKAETLSVYAEMSTDSEVVSTLARGKSVRITLSVTNGDGTWCSISDIDSSAKLGFVRCDQLDRQNVPSTAASGIGTLSPAPYDSTSSNQRPTRPQQRWAMAASAILSSADHEPLDTMPAGGSVLGIKRLLQDSWGISNRDQFLQTLDWIDQGGHRQPFSLLGTRTATLSPSQLSAVTSRLNSEDANSVIVAHRYYEKYGAQSITAWDYARYINLCRWGVAAGYISEEEAWPRAMHAAQILQQTFTSWKELGENYLVGRQFWSLRQTKIDGQAMRAIYEGLLSKPSSPWNRIPWDLPLAQSDSNRPGSSTTSPSAESSDAGALSGPCEQLETTAARGQSSDLESVLQTAPDRVNCRDSHRWTPLHHAAFNGQTAMIHTLVAHGAALEATDNDGNTPLHVAASAGNADAIEALLQSGAKIDALDHARDTPLQNAAAEGSLPAIDALLKHRPAIDARSSNGFTPLQTAAFRGNVEVVRVLLDHGANLESRDDEGYTPLNTAVWSRQTDVIPVLLAANANVNTRSDKGTTPLHGVASTGSIEIATLLIEHGARVDAGDAHGFTPLHYAANDDHADIADFLIEHGANINARTDAGDTPLHWAAFNDRLETAKLLLEKGAHVNPSDRDGNTPLHWAAARGHVEMTELLIAHGADLKAKTRFGCTPLRGAFDDHQAATARVLEQHGAPQ